MTPRALLAADCGRGVGLGHIERMLALADALQPELGVVVLVPDDDEVLRRRVIDRGHSAIAARGDTPRRVASAVAASPPFDVVVLDGYVFDVELQRQLRERAPLTVVDDLCLPADCDLAVNPSPGGEALRPKGARAFMGGAAYALIRASVVTAREMASRGAREPRTVLVSTGATDPARLGLAVSHALLDRDPTVAVTRVVGPDSIDLAGDAWPREHLLVAPPDLAESSGHSHRLRRRRRHHSGAGRVRRMPVGDHGCGEQPGGAGSSPRRRRMLDRGGPGGPRRRVSDAPRRSDSACRDVDARSRPCRWSRLGTGRCGDTPPRRCSGCLMTTVAVIQARCGSTRFPRKVLAPLQGRPVLAHVIERVSRATLVDRVVVATTDGAGDDEVAALAVASGAGVTRGPEADVLTRYVMAAREHDADVIVRITADCPLTDPAIVDSVIRARSDNDAEYASNVEPPTFPEGYDCEVFTSACLTRVDAEASLDYEREHVTVRVREHMGEFRTAHVAHEPDLSAMRLTVDVPADLARVARLLDMLPPSPPPDLAAVIAAFERDPALQDQTGLPLRNERYRAQREAAHRT